MKKYLTLIIVLIVSCTNKEKYYGEWVMTYPYSDYQNDIERIIITKDSIAISSFPNFKKYSESLKLNRNSIELFNKTFHINVKNDSLLLFNNSTYIKKGYYMYDYEIYNKLVTVDYPEIKNVDTVNHKSYSYAFFGKKLNSNEFELQLNDRITAFEDLRLFLMPGHHSGIIDLSLTADKNSKMKDINEIFYYSKSVSVRKIKLVNSVKYYLNDNKNINTSEEGIYIQLNDFKEYRLMQKENEPPRMIPPPLYSLKSIINRSNFNVISLIKNEIHFDTQKVSKNDLSNLTEKNYDTDKHFIILYDDESIYGRYLELINTIQKSIDKMRNEESLKVFKKPFDSLSKNEKREMVIKIPKNIINGISFNDFKKLSIQIPELELVN